MKRPKRDGRLYDKSKKHNVGCFKKKVNGVWIVYVYFHQPGVVTFIMEEIPLSHHPGFPSLAYLQEVSPRIR